MKMKRTVRMPLRRAPQRTRPPASSLRARAATAEEAYDEDEEDYGGEEEPNMKLSHAFMVVLILHVIAVIGVFAFNSIKAGQSAAAKTGSKAPAESVVTRESAPAPAVTTTAAAPSTPAANLDGWKGKTHTVAAKETLTSIAAMTKTTVEAIEKENGITSYSVIRVGQVLKIPGTETSKAASAKEAATKQAFIATKTEASKPVEDVIPLTSSEKPAPIKAAPAQLAEPAVVKAAPAPAPVTAAPAPAPAPAAASTAGSGDVYVVAKGDNPYSIAKKLHVSYNDLIAANDIKDPTKIQIGQKLKVPTKKN